jgi:hypothetical protein
MVNIRLCHKCKYKMEIGEPKFDNRGEQIVLLSVHCGTKNEEGIFCVDDEPPNWCPYLLEHDISMQDAKED